MKKNYEFVGELKKGWTKQPNAILYDDKLTSDAKVVIYALISVSGNFHISESGIANTINLSLDRVKKAVKLLKATGYIEITKVMNNSRLDGYIWKIAYTNGTLRKGGFQELENHATENQATENPSDDISSDRDSKRPKTRQMENTPLYESTERYKQTNNEKRIDEVTEREEERENEEDLSPNSSFQSVIDSLGKSSSEAKASPPSSKTPVSGSGLISQTDLTVNQAFDRFCEVYPNLADKNSARVAFLAIPDIGNLCWQIVNSVEWFEKSGKWNNWTTGQKNVSCPQAAKFLKRGDWQQYLKSGATMSEEERIMAVLNRSKQPNNIIFGGTEYESN